MIAPKHVIIASAVLLAAAAAGWRALAPEDAPRHATVLPAPAPLPDFQLRNHRGEAFTRADLAGRPTLAFFGFTHCPDICPATLQQLAAARERLARQTPETPLPEILLISVDPERDSPEKLDRYVAHFGEGVTGVTGDLAELRKLASSVGVYFEKVPIGDDGDYTMNHSSAVLLIDSDGAVSAIFSAPHRRENFVHDLPILVTG